MAEHETKYIFPAQRATSLVRWLMSRCDEDGEYPRGIISSVYYDTLDWNFLQEKINSDYLKTKFRLRWYQDSQSKKYSPHAYFEKKQKIGSSRRKTRVKVELDEAVKRARYLNEPYFMHLPAKLYCDDLLPSRTILPVFQISYERHRFIDNLSGARLAVDVRIGVPRINPSMVRRVQALPLDVGVFEYKSDQIDLPEWLHGVTLFGCRKGAFSKYSSCFANITGLPV